MCCSVGQRGLDGSLAALDSSCPWSSVVTPGPARSSSHDNVPYRLQTSACLDRDDCTWQAHHVQPARSITRETAASVAGWRCGNSSPSRIQMYLAAPRIRIPRPRVVSQLSASRTIGIRRKSLMFAHRSHRGRGRCCRGCSSWGADHMANDGRDWSDHRRWKERDARGAEMTSNSTAWQ